jgi:hypothetical protein
MNTQQHREEVDLFEADSLERRLENDARLRGFTTPPPPPPQPRMPTQPPLPPSPFCRSPDTPSKDPWCSDCCRRNWFCSKGCRLLWRSSQLRSLTPQPSQAVFTSTPAGFPQGPHAFSLQSDHGPSEEPPDFNFGASPPSQGDIEVKTPTPPGSPTCSDTNSSTQCVRAASEGTPELTLGASALSQETDLHSEGSSDDIELFSSPYRPESSQIQEYGYLTPPLGLLAHPVTLPSSDITASPQDFELGNLSNEGTHLALVYPSSQLSEFSD